MIITLCKLHMESTDTDTQTHGIHLPIDNKSGFCSIRGLLNDEAMKTIFMHNNFDSLGHNLYAYSQLLIFSSQKMPLETKMNCEKPQHHTHKQTHRHHSKRKQYQIAGNEVEIQRKTHWPLSNLKTLLFVSQPNYKWSTVRIQAIPSALKFLMSSAQPAMR